MTSGRFIGLLLQHHMNTDYQPVLVSVIVPVYNVSAYLDKCVKSLLQQTYNNIQIILVDDGSTDDSPTKCDNYAKQDSRITVVHKPNGGLSSARNVGLKNASGEYVMFVDSDDWVTQEFCQEGVNAIVKNHVDIASFGLCFVYDDHLRTIRSNSPMILEAKDAIADLITDEVPIFNYLCNKIFKRSLFDNIKFLEGYRFEDIAIAYRLIDKARKIFVSDKVTYYYLQRGGSITSTYNDSRSVRDRFFILNQRLDFLKGRYPKAYQVALKEISDQAIDILVTHYFRLDLVRMAFSLLHRHKKEILAVNHSNVLRVLAIIHII